MAKFGPPSLPSSPSSSARRYASVVLACVVLLGCRPAASPSLAPSSTDGISDHASQPKQPTASTALDPDAPQQQWNLRADQQPQLDDPASEGWHTESFQQRANQQLKRLGKLLVAEQWSPLPDDVLAPECRSTKLLPDQLKTLRDTPDIQVMRWDAPQTDDESPAATGATNNALTALQRLRGSMRDYDDLHFKFKLFRVTPGTDTKITRQYFAISGRTATGAREHNATWEIHWRERAANQPPQIASLRLLSLEQVTTRQPGGAWFTDATVAAMRGNACYSAALTQGIGQWQDTLEQKLGVYNLGHHGLSVGDVNNDGRDDLFICQTGGLPNHLLIQRPDGSLYDISAAAGVDFFDNTRSALLIDLDNDGDQDLALACSTGLLFLEQVTTTQTPPGTLDSPNSMRIPQFRLRARISSVSQAFSLSAADYDNDGNLDIYACVYYATPDVISELPLPLPYFDATNGGHNFLIRHDGNWKFQDVTDDVGLGQDNSRFSLASAWEDYDNDGDLDLMVINDFGPNQLFRYQNGDFQNVAADVGLLDSAFGMSASFADIDHDANMDLYVSNMFSAAGNRITFQPQFKQQLSPLEKRRFQRLARGNSLFRNRGDGSFDDVSVAQRVTMGRWAWASLFADVDNDSWDDLLVANGYLTGKSPDDL